MRCSGSASRLFRLEDEVVETERVCKDESEEPSDDSEVSGEVLAEEPEDVSEEPEEVEAEAEGCNSGP